MPVTELTLMRACLKSGNGYWKVRSDIIRGRLKGRQDADGHWLVDARDLDRYIAERQAEPTAPQAA